MNPDYFDSYEQRVSVAKVELVLDDPKTYGLLNQICETIDDRWLVKLVDHLILFNDYKLIDHKHWLNDDNDFDYIVISNGKVTGVIAFTELAEFKTKKVSGCRLFFDLVEEWDRYNRCPVMLPAPDNEQQCQFVIDTLSNLDENMEVNEYFKVYNY